MSPSVISINDSPDDNLRRFGCGQTARRSSVKVRDSYRETGKVGGHVLRLLLQLLRNVAIGKADGKLW